VLRRDAHLVPLSSDRVLVLGNGEATDGIEVPLSGELWDPATGAWTEIENLNKARTDFVAVALADDRVLVAGGLNQEEPQQSYSSAYLYDPRPGHEGWTKTGLMVAARSGASAARLQDGRVLVAGGNFHVNPVSAVDAAPAVDLASYPGPALFDIDPPNAGVALATAELFDPATGTWSEAKPMNYARHRAAAVTLADGRVLIVGSDDSSSDGFGITVDPLAFVTAELYDPATGRFTLAGRLPDVDWAAIEAGGEPGANTRPDGDGAPLDVGTLVATQDGGAVLIGHTRWWKHVADLTRSFRFDPATATWSEIGKPWASVGEPSPVPLTTPGVRNVAATLVAAIPGGRILVAGGAGESGNGSDVAELYDPATDAWTPLSPMPDARWGGTAATLADGSVLIVGGLIDEGVAGAAGPKSAVRFVP
jgi:hypothetical protein